MSRAARWTIGIALAVVALFVVYLGVTLGQVWWASRQDDARAASAIVVMGAAQYDGRPSPVLKARLDHAADLWRQDLADLIIVTGGKQEGDRVTQGFAGYDYLTDQDIPEDAIRVEVDGTDSFQELSAAAFIVRDAGLPPEVLIVSDPYHAFRVAQIAGEVGLRAAVSPTGTNQSVRELVRETAAVAIGRIVGYRRLSNWT
jgi:uncharacterized SAM-binding protein YcdF (DUF218 family)